MRDWLGLTDRRALVVGAGGFGGACARALLAEQARVYLADRDPRQLDAADVPTARHGVWDVADPRACEEVVAEAIKVLGGLDVVIHAVGVNDRRPLLEFEPEDWQRILDVNLTSAFHLGRAAGRHMCANGGGRIVMFSSVSGLLAHPKHGPYAASKGGMNQLLKVMAIEWAPHGVTVNGVAPGYTASKLTEGHLSEPGVHDELVAKVPVGRLGTLEDAVGPVLFLCSDQASYVTGQVLYVDGGRTLD